jgi:hypothetical protein
MRTPDPCAVIHNVWMEPLYVPAGHMTARQVASTLGIGPSGVRQLVARGHLTSAGGSPRQPYYDTEQVLAILAQRDSLDSRSAAV